MIESVKQLWLKALRSGKYKQGRNNLRTEDEFCCLGVLCDLYQKETGQGSWEEDIAERKRFLDGTGDDSLKVLPAGVKDWAGVAVGNPDVFGGEDSCAGLNDNGEDFLYIANAIEESL